jgi:short-subunit dehydrogenase
MRQTLAEKHILITGASGGIGEQIAYEAARRGAVPILAARNESKLRSVADRIRREHGITAPVYTLDIGDLQAVELVCEQIFKDNGYIDVLINNAGFGIFEDVVEAKMENMQSMFQVNVIGLIACTKMVLPHMLERNTGHIVNIASQAGKLATPKSSGYSATKHAVLGFTNSLRMELAKTGIFVTAVNPGPIKTNFFSIADTSGSYTKNVERFMLQPEEVAKKVVNAFFTKKRELNLPGWMNLGSTLYLLAPRLVEKLAGDRFHQK